MKLKKNKNLNGEVELGWMPLIIEKFLVGTGHMTAAELGGYLLLIIEQWKKGYVQNDKQKLKRLAKVTEKQLDVILEKYIPAGEGKLINNFCKELRDEQLTKYEERVKSASKAANVRWAPHTERMPAASVAHTVGDAEFKSTRIIDNTNVLNQQQQSHVLFAEKLFNKECEYDKENIELQLNPKRRITKEDCEAFNSHLHTEQKHHLHWSEYTSHLRNWLNSRPDPSRKKVNKPEPENITDNDVYKNSKSAV